MATTAFVHSIVSFRRYLKRIFGFLRVGFFLRSSIDWHIAHWFHVEEFLFALNWINLLEWWFFVIESEASAGIVYIIAERERKSGWKKKINLTKPLGFQHLSSGWGRNYPMTQQVHVHHQPDGWPPCEEPISHLLSTNIKRLQRHLINNLSARLTMPINGRVFVRVRKVHYDETLWLTQLEGFGKKEFKLSQ